MRISWRAIGLSLAGLAVVHLVQAEPEWLTWDAPPECPDASHIVGRVESWLGGPVAPTKPLHVQAGVLWEQGLWHVRTDVEYGATRGQRDVLVDTCAEAADFVALNVALVIDPRVTTRGAEAEGRERGAIAVVAGEDHPSSRDGAVPSGTEAPATPFEDPSGTTSAPVSRMGSPDRARNARWFIGLAVASATGILPGWRVGPQLDLGLWIGGLRLSVDADYFPPRTQDLGARDPVRSSLAVAGLRGCYQFNVAGRRLLVGPCVSGQIGGLLARGSNGGASDLKKAAIFGSASLSGQLDWVLNRHWGTQLNAGVIVPFRPARFVLTDEQVVFRPSPGLLAHLGFAWVL